MVKAISLGRLLQHATLEARIKGIEHRGVRQTGGGTKEGVRHFPTNDSRHTQNLCRCGAEALQPAGQEVQHGTLEWYLIAEELPAALDPLESTALPQGPYHLLRKEGISRRQAMDGLDNCSVNRAIVQQAHHEHLAVRPIEASQKHLVYPLLPMECPDELSHRTRRRCLFRAEGAKKKNGVVSRRADKIMQELKTGLVGVVEVIQPKQNG
jgi:hypothetical protein